MGGGGGAPPPPLSLSLRTHCPLSIPHHGRIQEGHFGLYLARNDPGPQGTGEREGGEGETAK